MDGKFLRSTMMAMTKTKIVVLDDDPTGSQTVHSCLLLSQWDVSTLKVALNDDSSPLFFVLTNTRGMSQARAAELTRQVCHNLKSAFDQLVATGITIHPLLVSRSDSTLRGHYPVETNVMEEELGPFDAHFLVPAFLEGGRVTMDSTHYMLVDGQPIPCHETEFAKDSVFGYSTSFLPEYVQEKTNGAIAANQVVRFRLEDDDVRAGDCTQRLLRLHNNTCCVVDAVRQADLNRFCVQLLDVAVRGKKRFLFRSGASLLTALARLPPQPVAPQDMARYVPHGQPGVVLVGSHVPKTTAQLEQLLQLGPSVVHGVEVDVKRIRRGEQTVMLSEITQQVQMLHNQGINPVIYTSRNELVDFNTTEQRLEFGHRVSNFLMEVVQRLPPTLGFLISKGGITSNDVLSKGLDLKTSMVLGQIMPGCSVVRCPDDHPRYPQMPVVIFPGNVGDDQGLATILQRLSYGLIPSPQQQQQQQQQPQQHQQPQYNPQQDPQAEIHKMVTRRYKELRRQGMPSMDAMAHAREELATPDEYDQDAGRQVAAMFGVGL